MRINKKKISKTARNLSLAVLETIASLGELVPRTFEDKQAMQSRLKRSMMGLPAYTVNKTIKKLEHRGLVQRRVYKSKVTYKLTADGKIKLLERSIKTSKKPRTDGMSSLVIFDIPEEQSKLRTYLRRLLLKNGFVNLQKSVLIGRFDLPDEFKQLMGYLKIKKNVTVIKGKILY